MANQWQRISQEAPFIAHCGEAGDELGSRLIAARLVRELMRLCFLIEQQYTPYIKWLGTAFSQLRCAKALVPVLSCVLSAETWHTREDYLSVAYTTVATMHNQLGVTPVMDAHVVPFHSRPYLVSQAGHFVQKPCMRRSRSPEVRSLPPHIGSIDQFVDSTDILDAPDRCKSLKAIFDEKADH